MHIKPLFLLLLTLTATCACQSAIPVTMVPVVQKDDLLKSCDIVVEGHARWATGRSNLTIWENFALDEPGNPENGYMTSFALDIDKTLKGSLLQKELSINAFDPTTQANPRYRGRIDVGNDSKLRIGWQNGLPGQYRNLHIVILNPYQPPTPHPLTPNHPPALRRSLNLRKSAGNSSSKFPVLVFIRVHSCSFVANLSSSWCSLWLCVLVSKVTCAYLPPKKISPSKCRG